MVCIIIVCKWYLIPIPKPKLQNLFEGTNVHAVHQDFARFLTLLETSLARFEFHRTCITVVQPNSSRFRPLFLAWLLYDVCTKPSRSHGSFGVANANPCIKAWDYIYIYLEKHKLDFFWLNGFDWFFWSLRRCILYRQMWPYMFFFNISVRLFFNKMLKNYGFAMPLASEPRPYMAIFAHIWPYMTIFFGHPESTASIRFDHCFWSLRVIVVIDEIFCVLRGLAKTTEKKHVYVVTGIYKSLGLSASHFGVRITLRLPISCVQFFFAFWYIQASIQKTAPSQPAHGKYTQISKHPRTKLMPKVPNLKLQNPSADAPHLL